MNQNGYAAGWNDPGYLPEMEPEEFRGLEDARRFLIAEAKRREDESADCGAEDEATEWSLFAEDLNFLSHSSAAYAPDGSEWWVYRQVPL